MAVKDENLNMNFSEDPQENLRIENEILKLKMQAESGAVFGGPGGLPAEIENQFLQQVQQFEDAWSSVKYVSVYDYIGRPEFLSAASLTDEEVGVQLKRITDTMSKMDVFLDIIGNYEPRVIYQFITEELFEHQTDDMQLPGWSKNFIFEEFHPNHKMDIEKAALNFLEHWFEKQFDEYSLEMNNEIITENGKVYSGDEIKEKLNTWLSFYEDLSNEQYTITDVCFQWNDEEVKGLGHAEGIVKYDAKIEDGSIMHFEGPFKLYVSNEEGYWNIFYFIMPGFKW